MQTDRALDPRHEALVAELMAMPLTGFPELNQELLYRISRRFPDVSPRDFAAAVNEVAALCRGEDRRRGRPVGWTERGEAC